jgi:exodeoxyribonuclease VII large subunit
MAQLVAGRGGASRRLFTVSELVEGLRELLEEEIGRVLVAGEISNLRRAASGHAYFTLKDDGAQLRAALFRGDAARLPFEPEEGLAVVAEGTLSLYPARGELQLVVRRLEPRGRGALQLAFEQLRARLAAEGLFDPAAKRPLPAVPRRVGVVTSPSGAALHDVLRVAGERFPGVPLLLAPARVQGEGAEGEIAAALAALQDVPDVDVVLLVRGGGSLEDLWPFNTERVARALRASRVPVACGVGHEVDVTIACLAADAQAPTPSAAAALVVPDRRALSAALARDVRRLRAAALARVARGRLRLARAREALRVGAPAARLAAQAARLRTAARALSAAGRAACAGPRGRLAGCAGRLDALSPLAVLGRGYAIAWRAVDLAIVRRAADVAAGDPILVRVAEAELDAEVRAARPIPGPGRSRA